MFGEVSIGQVLLFLRQRKKGSGRDIIPTNLVKCAAEQIALPLAMIVNASLENGSFPEIWKSAMGAQIYKFKATDDETIIDQSPFSVFFLEFSKKSHNT